MTVRNRRLHEKLGMDRVRGCNAEKFLSFCHLTKQRLINELADEVNERHSWHDAASPDYRPKFHVFTEKAWWTRMVAPHQTVVGGSCKANGGPDILLVGMLPRTARRNVMDPTTTFCPNRNCPARGQTGQGNIGIHSRKE